MNKSKWTNKIKSFEKNNQSLNVKRASAVDKNNKNADQLLRKCTHKNLE